MGPVEVMQVFGKKVKCSGGGIDGVSTHPLVYLNMGEKKSVTCPYCSKTFTINQLEPKIISKYNILNSKIDE